jgi:hypothetical protein
MKVTKINGSVLPEGIKAPEYTNEQLQRELGYIQAEKMTKKLLAVGLISEDEFNKIMAENRKIFSPHLAPLL